MAEQVTLSTDSVTFAGPWNEERAVELWLHNPSDRRVVFKVKSTRLRRFKTRPAFGLIEPGEHAVVRLSCQPLSRAPTDACADRFSIVVGNAPTNISTAESAWRSNEIDEKLSVRHPLPVSYTDYPVDVTADLLGDQANDRDSRDSESSSSCSSCDN